MGALLLGVILFSSLLSSSTLTGLPMTDLSILKTNADNTTSAQPNEQVSYNLTVENNGSFATNVGIVDPLSPLVTFEFINAIGPDCTYQKRTHTVFCLKPEMPDGSQFSVEIGVSVNDDATPGSEIINNAMVTSNDVEDINSENDDSSTSILVEEKALCDCERFGVIPKGLEDIPVTRSGNVINVQIIHQWNAFITCEDAAGTGCKVQPKFEIIEADFFQNTEFETSGKNIEITFMGDQMAMVIKDGKPDQSFTQAKKVSRDNFQTITVECTGENCPSKKDRKTGNPVPEEKTFRTKFETNLQVLPAPSGNPWELLGFVKLKVTADQGNQGPTVADCDNVDSWTLGLAFVTLNQGKSFGVINSISDDDGDGLLNIVDNCPKMPNPNQEDDDGDGHGNACDRFPDNPRRH